MEVGLAAFLVVVFPGNLHQYAQLTSAFNLDMNIKRLVRLSFQPVLMSWALWSNCAWKALR